MIWTGLGCPPAVRPAWLSCAAVTTEILDWFADARSDDAETVDVDISCEAGIVLMIVLEGVLPRK